MITIIIIIIIIITTIGNIVINVRHQSWSHFMKVCRNSIRQLPVSVRMKAYCAFDLQHTAHDNADFPCA